MQSSRRQRPPAMQSEPLMGGPAPSMAFQRFLCFCFHQYLKAAWLWIARPIVARSQTLKPAIGRQRPTMACPAMKVKVSEELSRGDA